MTDYKKINNLIHLADRAIAEHHYPRAKKLIEQLLHEALEAEDYRTAYLVGKALTRCQDLHILDIIRDFKRIDPIQAKRKVLS